MIELRSLTKRYRSGVAVDDLSAQVRPGLVTGFLGPNGAGKSTTMRIVVGLDRPDAGVALVNGVRHVDRRYPLCEVGVVLDARAALASRRCIDHLGWLARANRIDQRRVRAVLELCGIAELAPRRVGRLSLGMAQRLALAAALLGDPGVLILDEPTNGLDPEGIVWLRGFLRSMAAEGRTVLVSSHLMGEMSETADRVVVIGRGRLLADCATLDLPARAGLQASVRARGPRIAELLARLGRLPDATVTSPEPNTLLAYGLDADEVAAAAAEQGTMLTELVTVAPSLEQAYLHLTAASTDHVSTPVPVSQGLAR